MAVLDFPAAPTAGQVATLTNGFSYQWDGAVWTLTPASPGQVAGGDLTGTYPNPSVTPAAKSKWTDTGVALTPVDATKILVVPGNSSHGTIQLGTQTAKTRVTASNTLAFGVLSYNILTQTGAKDDASRAAWEILLRHDTDSIQMRREASNKAEFYSSGDMQIWGSNAYKATGTSWINPSDPRLKRDIAPYATGLQAILSLEPISFFYNGKGGTTDDGRQCYGYDASAVQSVLPECVGTRRGKLDKADAAETDILTLDTSNFTLALINAVKELAQRVAALEAAR
jgi:hypothetical protein